MAAASGLEQTAMPALDYAYAMDLRMAQGIKADRTFVAVTKGITPGGAGGDEPPYPGSQHDGRYVGLWRG
jgi:hypothetical protein